MVEIFKTPGKTGFFGGSKITPKVSVVIDFPRERDVVSIGHYAIRISGSAGSQAEVSVNGAAWKGCRFADGYYWFDWSPAKSGTYKLSARIRKGTNAWETSAERACVVMPPKGK